LKHHRLNLITATGIFRGLMAALVGLLIAAGNAAAQNGL